MTKQEVFQLNFCLGEISPHHRQETRSENYRLSLSELTNFIVTPSAKLQTRPSIIKKHHFNKTKELVAQIGKNLNLKENLELSKLFYIVFPNRDAGIMQIFHKKIIIFRPNEKEKKGKNPIVYETFYPIEDLNSINIAQTLKYVYIASKNQKILFVNLLNTKNLHVQSLDCFGNNLLDQPSKIIVHQDRLWTSSSILNPCTWWVSGLSQHLDPENNQKTMFSTEAERKASLIEKRAQEQAILDAERKAEEETEKLATFNITNNPLSPLPKPIKTKKEAIKEDKEDKEDKEGDKEWRKAPIYTSVKKVDDEVSVSGYFWFEYTVKYTSSIKWVVSDKHIIFGDKFREYSIRPINYDKSMTMNNITVVPETNIGSADQYQPIKIGNEYLFVDSSKCKIFVLTVPSHHNKGLASYIEISYLSHHLLTDGIKKIVYQKNPYGIIWILTSKNKLISLTYNASQKILGWAKHTAIDELDEFLDERPTINITDLEVCNEGDENNLYFLTNKQDKIYMLSSFTDKEINEQYTAVIKTHNLAVLPQHESQIKLFQYQIARIGMYIDDTQSIDGSLNTIQIEGKDTIDKDYIAVKAASYLKENIHITFEGTIKNRMTVLGLHAQFTEKGVI